MSNLNSQSVKFELLSDVQSEEDIFNKLVLVKHCLTGETGLLLCSHRSKWPTSLVPQAKWLAGCFTPSNAPLANLVFGYIPNQVINWAVNNEDKTVVLSIRGEQSDQQAMGQQLETFVYPVQMDPQYDQATKKQVHRLKAVKRLLFRDDTTVDQFTVIKGIVDYYQQQDPEGNIYDFNIVFYIAQALDLFEDECPADTDDKYAYDTWNFYMGYQSQRYGFETYPCEL